MFRQIEELAEDPKAFVFVLIDEVNIEQLNLLIQLPNI